jgi:hypothetical protein
MIQSGPGMHWPRQWIATHWSGVAKLPDRSRVLNTTLARSDGSDPEIGPPLYRWVLQFTPFVVRFPDRAIHGQLGRREEYHSWRVRKTTRCIHHPRFAGRTRMKSRLVCGSCAVVQR